MRSTAFISLVVAWLFSNAVATAYAFHALMDGMPIAFFAGMTHTIVTLVLVGMIMKRVGGDA
jgi:hypothetical protein